MWFRLIAVAVSLMVSLLLIELVLQVLDYPPQIVSGWRSKALAVQQNQMAYRGRPIEIKPDDFVVVLLGDSQAAGWGLSFNDIPEKHLEWALWKRGVASPRVVTVAAPSYGQDQELLALREYFDKYGYRANLVLLWETPYNDLYDNTFPNQRIEGSPAKPTFALVDGELVGPTSQIGEPLLSRVRLWALCQKKFSERVKLLTSDRAWAEKYLPAPYQPIEDDGPKTLFWQQMRDRGFGYMPFENFDNDKSSFAIGMIPTSPRVAYGVELTHRLIQEIQRTAKSHDSRYAAFEVRTKTSWLAGQPLHMEPVVYEVDGKKYRFSFAQQFANTEKMNTGLPFLKVPCDVDDWRIALEDTHLNGPALINTMEHLADQLIADGLVPATERGADRSNEKPPSRDGGSSDPK
ncbi:MAG: hypothetical protein GC159_03775 [Phycisphaera sp.]|nr:hypothetical protein [Phycisphaera sp.]